MKERFFAGHSGRMALDHAACFNSLLFLATAQWHPAGSRRFEKDASADKGASDEAGMRPALWTPESLARAITDRARFALRQAVARGVNNSP